MIIDMTNVPADEEPRYEEYDLSQWKTFGLEYYKALRGNGNPGRVVWMGSAGGTVYVGITLVSITEDGVRVNVDVNNVNNNNISKRHVSVSENTFLDI